MRTFVVLRIHIRAALEQLFEQLRVPVAGSGVQSVRTLLLLRFHLRDF